MPMGCCSACHRHVMATDNACPFCQAPVKSCRTVGGVLKQTLLGTSLLAGASFVSACPAYGVPAPPMTPAPSGYVSHPPSLPPSVPPSTQP
jgi:hypothetical protein